MAAYDGGRTPEPNKDPTKETQWEIQGIASDIGKAILDAIAGLTDAAKQALEELIGGAINGVMKLVEGLFKALLTGDIIGGIEAALMNIPGIGLLASAILGPGAEVGDLSDWFSDGFASLAAHIPGLSLFSGFFGGGDGLLNFASLFSNIDFGGDFTTAEGYLRLFGSLIPAIGIWLTQLMFGGGTDPGFPYTFPVSWDWEGTSGGLLAPIVQFFALFRNLFPGIDFLNDIFDPVALAEDIPKLASNVLGMLGGIANGVVGTATGLLGDFLSALLGFGPKAVPAYTPENAAVANVQTQVNFLLADNDPSTSGFFDGFNTPPTLSSTWTQIFGPMDAITTDGTYWHPVGYNAKRYNAARPGTAHWQVQGSIAYFQNHGGLAGRILCGVNPADWTQRYPAIEVLNVSGNDTISIVSLQGNPNSVANANIGRQVHATATYGPFVIKGSDVVALECNETTGMYYLYLNPGPSSTPLLVFDDHLTNLFTRGVGHRDLAMQINVNNTADPFQGAGWDNISAFDRVT